MDEDTSNIDIPPTEPPNEEPQEDGSAEDLVVEKTSDTENVKEKKVRAKKEAAPEPKKLAKKEGQLNFHHYTSTKSWRGYIFTAVCLCVCLCVCLSVCRLDIPLVDSC